jgi:hypothetical protein
MKPSLGWLLVEALPNWSPFEPVFAWKVLDECGTGYWNSIVVVRPDAPFCRVPSQVDRELRLVAEEWVIATLDEWPPAQDSAKDSPSQP